MTGPILEALTGLFASEEGHGATWLGLPMWVWQSANLALFFFLLWRFLAKPLTEVFRGKQREVEERRLEAERRREESTRLAQAVRTRMAQLEREIVEIREQGRREGESERAALVERADLEAERVLREAQAEIARRLAAAREELQAVAADLTAAVAREILEKSIDENDRRRLLEDGLARMRERAS